MNVSLRESDSGTTGDLDLVLGSKNYPLEVSGHGFNVRPDHCAVLQFPSPPPLPHHLHLQC